MPCSTFCGWGGKPGIYTTRIAPPVLSLFHYGRSGKFHLNVSGSLKRRLGRINKLSELIRRRSDIEARMISTMRDLNSAYSVAKQRTQVSLHRSVRWMKGGTENGSQSSHPVHGRYHGETVWLVLHSSVALQNEVPDYCQYYLQQYKVKSVNLALEVVPFSKISTEWHTQPLVIIVDRLQLAI